MEGRYLPAELENPGGAPPPHSDRCDQTVILLAEYVPTESAAGSVVVSHQILCIKRCSPKNFDLGQWFGSSCVHQLQPDAHKKTTGELP
jgi:hypothetical protein